MRKTDPIFDILEEKGILGHRTRGLTKGPRTMEVMMKQFLTWSLILTAALLIAACGQQPAQEAAAPEPEPQAAEPQAEPAAEVVEMVEVTAEGSTFEPAVEVAQIPDGAWYCPMETVHYAQLEQGEGKCPSCGMDLVQKVAAAEPVDEPMDEPVDEPADEGGETEPAAHEG